MTTGKNACIPSMRIMHMNLCHQVRALTQLLPMIDVVEGDPFNSDPDDPKSMGPDALQRWRAGEKLPLATTRTPLVCDI